MTPGPVELDDDDRRPAAVIDDRRGRARVGEPAVLLGDRRAGEPRTEQPGVVPDRLRGREHAQGDDRLAARETEQPQHSGVTVCARVQAIERAAEIASGRHSGVRTGRPPGSRRAVRARIRARRHAQAAQPVRDRAVAERARDPVRGEVRRPEADLAQVVPPPALLRLRRSTQAGGERTELDGGRCGEARVGLVARVPTGGEVVHPDPGSAVRPRGHRGKPPGERCVRTARAVPGRGAGQRRERRRAAEAGAAVEPLCVRYLRPAAREQFCTQRTFRR